MVGCFDITFYPIRNCYYDYLGGVILLKVKGFKYGIGDVLVPVNQEEAAIYLQEIVIDDIHAKDFRYTVIDIDGDSWQASPIMIEKEFKLKEGA